MLSRPVVAAEGAACLDLRPPKRPGIEDKPAPSGNVNDRDFFIVCTCQRRSPPIFGLCRRLLLNAALPAFDRQGRARHKLCHDDLPGGPDIRQILHGFHIVHKHGVVPAREPLYELGYLHARPNFLGQGEPIIAAAIVGKAEGFHSPRPWFSPHHKGISHLVQLQAEKVSSARLAR